MGRGGGIFVNLFFLIIALYFSYDSFYQRRIVEQLQSELIKLQTRSPIHQNGKTWAESLLGPIPSEATAKIEPLQSLHKLQLALDVKYAKGESGSFLSPLDPDWDTLHGNMSLSIKKKEKLILRVDDVIQGYQQIFEGASLFTYTNFLGVSLQQDPSDAFALMDLIWRLKPDLLIELGTAGGGSAFFYGLIMTAYNKNAHVITMDPMRLEDWNKQSVEKVCKHCISGRETKLWNSDTIHFLHMLPTDPNTTQIVDEYIRRWNPQVILVMEDSNHKTEIVRGNIETYAKYVTPGSYLVVQDMKMGRLYRNGEINPPLAVSEFLKTPLGQEFEVDRTFEYYLYTQHAKGFLKRRSPTPSS